LVWPALVRTSVRV